MNDSKSITSKFGVSSFFEDYFKEVKIASPSSVQQKVIPILLQGSSAVVVSQTGTGKTLAFCLPLVEKIKKLEEAGVKSSGVPRAVVLAPTRELVDQIGTVLKEISRTVGIKIGILTGGLGKEKSRSVKMAGCDILVTTPKKLVKAAEYEEVFLGDVSTVVFDEADNLFEMGYAEDVKTLKAEYLRYGTQFCFFTATMPDVVKTILDEVFQAEKPALIRMPGAHSLIKKVETVNIPMDETQRYGGLTSLFGQRPSGRGIVFVTTKREIHEVYEKVEKDFPRLKKTLLHGDLESDDRRKAYKQVRDYKVQVLFTTDLAARGMDFEDIDWVINYTLPKTTDYYLHRCGRTGRMGKKGFVFNFVSPNDKQMIAKINRALTSSSELKIDSGGLDRLRRRGKKAGKPLSKAEKEAREQKRKAATVASRRGGGRTLSKLESDRLKKERHARLHERREKLKKKAAGKKRR